MMKRKPTSPGEILIEEFLKPMGMTQEELSVQLGCVVNEGIQITPGIATKLAAAFNTTPAFWLNAQMALDLWDLRAKKPKIQPLIRSGVRRRLKSARI